MPRGSMRQFFNDRGGPGTDHGNYLFWPGTIDGYPVRGSQAPHLKREELETLAIALDYRSQGFRLWIPEEKQAFDTVMNRIVNGWYMQHKRFEHWQPDHAAYFIWLEWVQIYGEVPNSITPGSGSNAYSQTIPVGSTAGETGQPNQAGRPAAYVNL